MALKRKRSQVADPPQSPIKRQLRSNTTQGDEEQSKSPATKRRARAARSRVNQASTASAAQQEGHQFSDEDIGEEMRDQIKPKRKGKPFKGKENAAGEPIVSAPSDDPPQNSSRRATVVEVSIPTSRKRLPLAHRPRSSTPAEAEDVDSSATATEMDKGTDAIAECTLGPFSSCLAEQKVQILKAVASSSYGDQHQEANKAHKQLADLLEGTVYRAEGNSCLILGPTGSGKSKLVDDCLASLGDRPIILRLSGWLQVSDKHALRELGFQLLRQTGSNLLALDGKHTIEEEDGNPFLESPVCASDRTAALATRLPPPSELHALVPLLLSLDRPVIVVLDAFDLFALHPRQSLLYCLLDAVQSGCANRTNSGLAVIGMSSRIDTINLLEKRVKSRFSGRMIRTAPPSSIDSWMNIVANVLQTPVDDKGDTFRMDWNSSWRSSINDFVSDPDTVQIFKETFAIRRDIRMLQKLLIPLVLHLNMDEPHFTFKMLLAVSEMQRVRPRTCQLENLSYPSICLLIASIHTDIAGHPVFTFEMLYDIFREQLRSSTSAPVQLNGGNIGMVKCTRDVFMTAFDGLIAARLFVCSAVPSATVSKAFLKYRSCLSKEDVRKVVEKAGQVQLKKWLTKG